MTGVREAADTARREVAGLFRDAGYSDEIVARITDAVETLAAAAERAETAEAKNEKLSALIVEQEQDYNKRREAEEARWQELEHPFDKAEFDAMHARAVAAEAALTEIRDGHDGDEFEDLSDTCDRYRDIARAALAADTGKEKSEFDKWDYENAHVPDE